MALTLSVFSDYFFTCLDFWGFMKPYALHQQIADEKLAVVFSSKICNDYFSYMVFIFVECLSIQKLRFP